VDVDDLVGTHPRLYHMAESGSWPAIARHGGVPDAREHVVAVHHRRGPDIVTVLAGSGGDRS
jgi:hypothetical protein